ncbi:MAG: nucleoside monophosphate kinase [bacterium]
MGRSGCGKGTQAKLLIEHIKSGDPEAQVLYVETGNKFRDFIAGTSYSSRLAKEVALRGDLQPQFLAVHMWSDVLFENLMGDEHVVFAGTPRHREEAEVLDSALKFYGRNKVNVVFVDISPEETKKRMEARGRADDRHPGDIDKRLAWYEKDVVPAIKFFEEHPDYNLIHLNGEQPIEAVQRDLIKVLYGES